jgi:hypothetical protein
LGECEEHGLSDFLGQMTVPREAGCGGMHQVDVLLNEGSESQLRSLIGELA